MVDQPETLDAIGKPSRRRHLHCAMRRGHAGYRLPPRLPGNVHSRVNWSTASRALLPPAAVLLAVPGDVTRAALSLADAALPVPLQSGPTGLIHGDYPTQLRFMPVSPRSGMPWMRCIARVAAVETRCKCSDKTGLTSVASSISQVSTSQSPPAGNHPASAPWTVASS